MSHVNKSTSNSSSRIKVSDHKLKKHATAKLSKNQTKRNQRKWSKYRRVFPNEEKAVSLTELERKRLCYTNTSKDKLPIDHRKVEERCVSKDLAIVDTVNGAACFDDDNVPYFILLPRGDVAGREGSFRIFGKHVQDHAKTLWDVLNTTGHNVKRGSEKEGFTTHHSYLYKIMGFLAPQGTQGIHLSATSQENDDLLERVQTIVKQVDNAAQRFVPADLLRGIHAAKSSSDWMSIGKFWASAACSADFFATMHVDMDFFLSAYVPFVRNAPESASDMQAPIVKHFCFPSIGLAVALRLWDVLFFNPRYFHGCSRNEASYQVLDFACYLKTNVVGGNDNNKELTDEQQAIVGSLGNP